MNELASLFRRQPARFHFTWNEFWLLWLANQVKSQRFIGAARQSYCVAGRGRKRASLFCFYRRNAEKLETKVADSLCCLQTDFDEQSQRSLSTAADLLALRNGDWRRLFVKINKKMSACNFAEWMMLNQIIRVRLTDI